MSMEEFGIIIKWKYPRNRRGTAIDSTANTTDSLRAGLKIKSGLLCEKPSNNGPNHSRYCEISRINEILFPFQHTWYTDWDIDFCETQTQAIRKQETYCLRLYCVNCTTERVSLNLLYFRLQKFYLREQAESKIDKFWLPAVRNVELICF